MFPVVTVIPYFSQVRRSHSHLRHWHPAVPTRVASLATAVDNLLFTQSERNLAHLSERQWLELNRPTIADVACFPYIALAAEGKISLDAYPNVVAWIERIKQLPGYISIWSLD
ncbi:MAG: glutathione binding-like protein [Rhizonema sp. PD38]|nr:glutathione binding-like protein [Rhizonema sp. PD38]